jgi:hypothetical protein
MHRSALLIMFLPMLAMAQSSDRPPLVPASATVVRSAQVDSLLAMHRRYSEHKGGTDGYRVQLFSGSGNESRQQANDVRNDFLRDFPDVPAYLIFQSPNYKVRVGDLRTEVEAMRLKQDISYRFPGGFVVKDEIKFAQPQESR